MFSYHELGFEYVKKAINTRTRLISFAACWASSGYNVAGCAALETQLRTCMDTPVSFRQTQKYDYEKHLLIVSIAEAEVAEEKHHQSSLVPDVP
jgi:hypothetical protein